MANDGIKHALAFVTSAYSSYSSCRQYRQNITDAQTAVGSLAPSIEKLRAFYNHPLFIEANVEQIRGAAARLDHSRIHMGVDSLPSVHLAFTAHSIPLSMAENCDYTAQLNETGRLIAEQLSITDWKLVYQSRSGSPMQPWLGPDICDHLRDIRNKGVTEVVVAPIGFVSDHMEVIYDLDVEAQKVAGEIGMNIARASTAGTHPAFVKMIRELILEKTEQVPVRYLGTRPRLEDCAADCCIVRGS